MGRTAERLEPAHRALSVGAQGAPFEGGSKEFSVPTGRSRRRRRRGGGHGGHGAHGHGPSPGGQPGQPGPGTHPHSAPAPHGSTNGQHASGQPHGHGHGGHRATPQIVIEGFDPATAPRPRPFEDLTSIDPQPRLTLEYPGCPDSCRLIDLFCPIGRGQRSLIVSPPKAGKTTLLKDIAGSIVRNHPDVQVIALLVDERPEEVTDFKRTFAAYGTRDDGSPRGQVIASSNDHGVERHIAVSTGTMDLCKRMVEAGRHVVVVLDSLTRLGRAFNLSRRHASSGRTLSGGLDSRALEVPRQIFGSARNTEEAGSLTIIASVLVDTGSAQDQVIFEEFKGSGNMELILDRKISEKRLFPAINLAASGTRKEHLLMPEQELKTVTALRRRLIAMPPHVQVEQLLGAMKRFKTNAELVGSAG
ncbi:MAG: transcription termination factor Rho [Phycisphaeraceae bacterium]|nr:transcription termination factor Rho [Phycisphaeraceae bacterium]